MINLLDYILDLFRDEGQAQAFVANPDQALADAGLSTVSSAQLQSVAAAAIPSLAMGGNGDPVADLQQAVSSHYGFEPSFAPQPDISGSTDLASNNSFIVVGPPPLSHGGLAESLVSGVTWAADKQIWRWWPTATRSTSRRTPR